MPLASRFALPLAIALISSLPVRADEQMVDGIAAQVGPDIVLYSEVMQMAEPMERRMRQMGATDVDIAKIRADALERMIEWRIIEQVVQDAELFATEAEVDETIETIAQQNGLTVGELRSSVTQHGLGYGDYRSQIKRELERRKVLNAMVRSHVRIEKEDVEALYAERYGDQPEGGPEVHVRQILITYGGDTGRDQQTACSLVAVGEQRVKKGDPFAAVATDLSEVAPEVGGDIGWLMENSLASWMKEILAPLQPSQTSQLAVLPFGCILLHLVERRDYQPVSYEQAEEQLTDQVFGEAMADEYAEWLETRREGTFIERRGYFAEAASLSNSRLFGVSSTGDLEESGE